MSKIELTPVELQEYRQGDSTEPVLIDVRSEVELVSGMIPDAIFAPLGQLKSYLQSCKVETQTKPLCFICESGVRSEQAMTLALEMGFPHVMHLKGGMRLWREFDLPLTFPIEAPSNWVERYKRQIALPEVGLRGQKALQEAKVLVIGAGGLGSPVLLYLASSGVGTLGIVDPDIVERHNLHRQILHSESAQGQAKVESAAAQLRAINSEVDLHVYPEAFNADNAERLISRYDIVVDCTDRLRNRYLANDVCLELGKPLVYGAIYRHEGQVAVFAGPKISENGACYRCLFPIEPDESSVPNCSLAGVLGPLPGLIGCMQAMETIKLILNLGKSLNGRLIVYNSLNAEQSEFRLQRDPTCRCQTMA